MEQEHGLISSLLEWAGRRVDSARMAEAVAEGLGGAQIPSVPFTSGSPQGDMDVSVFCLPRLVHAFKSFDSCLVGIISLRFQQLVLTEMLVWFH